MGPKRRKRSAAQILHMENMRRKRWASPGEAEVIDEVYRCVSMEEFKDRMAKAERETEKGRKELRNAERRLERLAKKQGITKRELKKDLGDEPDGRPDTRLETVTKECAHWKERTVELQNVLHQRGSTQTQGPNQITEAVNSAITILTDSRKPRLPPKNRTEERVFELVNELAFSWHLPTSDIAGIVGAVSRATVDVCYADLVDDVNIGMDEDHEFDELDGGSPVPDIMVAGPSNAVAPPEEPGRGREHLITFPP